MMTSRKRNEQFYSSLALIGALAGVLIWAKLRLSTDMPRAAYADPKDSYVDGSGVGGGGEVSSESPEQASPLIEGEEDSEAGKREED